PLPEGRFLLPRATRGIRHRVVLRRARLHHRELRPEHLLDGLGPVADQQPVQVTDRQIADAAHLRSVQHELQLTLLAGGEPAAIGLQVVVADPEAQVREQVTPGYPRRMDVHVVRIVPVHVYPILRALLRRIRHTLEDVLHVPVGGKVETLAVDEDRPVGVIMDVLLRRVPEKPSRRHEDDPQNDAAQEKRPLANPATRSAHLATPSCSRTIHKPLCMSFTYAMPFLTTTPQVMAWLTTRPCMSAVLR